MAIARSYRSESGTTVDLQFGAVGQLYQRLQHGQSAGLFISSDTAVPEALHLEQHAGATPSSH